MNERVVSVQETFGRTLVEIGHKKKNLIVVDADLMKASGSRLFKDAYPERHVQVGIAEQNLISISAGIAHAGNIVFASSFACFITRRACDQVSISVCYNRLNVKVCGDYAGYTSSKNGGTHSSIEDIAIMRSMPGMTVICPGDTNELAQAMWELSDMEGPAYLRKARGPMPLIFDDEYNFSIGKGIVLKNGNDITIISTGIMTYYVLKAEEVLGESGISVRVIHMPTIKPVDSELILEAAKETGVIVTVENHNIFGGLGSAIAEVVTSNFPIPVLRMGINDRFSETATLEWLLEHNKLSVKDIVAASKKGLELKRKLSGQESLINEATTS